MINELDEVVLVDDLPRSGLKAGDVGTVMLVHGGGKGFTLEFLTFSGETVAVVTVDAHQIRGFNSTEIPNARTIEMPLAA